jgi:hypothetical protein
MNHLARSWRPGQAQGAARPGRVSDVILRVAKGEVARLGVGPPGGLASFRSTV